MLFNLIGVGVIVLSTYVAIISAYMLLVALGSWLYRDRRGKLERTLSFAVLVPAHNEEHGIASTIGQLKSVNYPAELLEIHVIADNCTDGTAEAARRAGAAVLVRDDPYNRGKGKALDWALRSRADVLGRVDLIAFIDADMQMHPEFFQAMARKFAESHVVAAQGRYVVANPCQSVLSAMGFMSFCYVNHIRPAGRCYWGGTADLKGSGMVFRAGFIAPRGWPAQSIAEDVQFGKQLMLENVRVVYVPGACVTSDIPSTLSQVRVQQSRWEGGKKEIYASVVPGLLRALVRRPSKLLLDGLLDMMVPPLSLIILLNLAGLLASWWVRSDAMWVFFASLLIFAATILSGLVQNRAPLGVYWRLVAAPAFLLWKIGLLATLAFGRRPTEWHRTPRNPQ